VEFLRIVLLSMAAAILYGIVHDQVTARVCVEYFTVGHPPVFHTDSPTLLGLGWGILATWWVGLALGIALALSARTGSTPRLTAKDLLGPVVRLLLVMAALALVAGISGYLMVQVSGFRLGSGPASRLSDATQQRFVSCLFAHLASYGTGFLGGLILCIWAALALQSGHEFPLQGRRWRGARSGMEPVTVS
jgi:hypothetical protein